jgi:hypothetical protein
MLGLLFRSFPQLERSKFAIDVSVCGILAFFGLRSIYEALYDDKIDRGDSIVAENVIKNESLSNNGWRWSTFWKIFYLILSAELGIGHSCPHLHCRRHPILSISCWAQSVPI